MGVFLGILVLVGIIILCVIGFYVIGLFWRVIGGTLGFLTEQASAGWNSCFTFIVTILFVIIFIIGCIGGYGG